MAERGPGLHMVSSSFLLKLGIAGVFDRFRVKGCSVTKFTVGLRVKDGLGLIQECYMKGLKQVISSGMGIYARRFKTGARIGMLNEEDIFLCLSVTQRSLEQVQQCY